MSRILAVDDSPSMRELVSRTLQEEGHQVTTASNGQEALVATQHQKFDLVITDYNMPVMNGLAFIKAFREAGNKFTPVLVLTTEVNAQLKEGARAAGATGWLVKPFVPEAFRATVKRVL